MGRGVGEEQGEERGYGEETVRRRRGEGPDYREETLRRGRGEGADFSLTVQSCLLRIVTTAATR